MGIKEMIGISLPNAGAATQLVPTSGFFRIFVSVPLKQEGGGFDRTECSARKQRRTAREVPAIDVGPVIKQQEHEIDPVRHCRPVKRGASQRSIRHVDQIVQLARLGALRGYEAGGGGGGGAVCQR